VAAGARAASAAAEGGGLTTLVIALVDPDGRVEVGRVGDSTALVVAGDGSWRELFPGPDLEIVGTETDALPAVDIHLEVAATTLDERSVLVLVTDGVADPWRDGPTTVAPALVEHILARPSALDLARIADFSRQGCHDDRTLLCVWLLGAA
jgi:serine/threonine protein phosphatase PrpC